MTGPMRAQSGPVQPVPAPPATAGGAGPAAAGEAPTADPHVMWASIEHAAQGLGVRMSIALTHDVTEGEGWKVIVEDLADAAATVLARYGWAI